MKHLLEINDLSRPQIEKIVERALFFKSTSTLPRYGAHSLANLFYENSTRTRISFELAAKKLSMPVVNVDLHNSSESKGEILEDTLNTIAAMGISIVVVRHSLEKLPHQLASLNKTHIVNAGDGKNAHPSQALLDLVTISEKKEDLSSLKIAIVGDIYHSRVANSLQSLFATVKIKELILVAPSKWSPKQVIFGQTTHSLKEGISDADVVICLRVQKERLLQEEELDLQSYRKNYAITAETLAYAKPDVMVMHPGPINRGVEIDSEIADGPNSYILQQVQNGVFTRMAILDYLLT